MLSWIFVQRFTDFFMTVNANKLRMNRRRFLGVSSVSMMGLQVVPSRVFGANSRLAVASIGAGGDCE